MIAIQSIEIIKPLKYKKLDNDLFELIENCYIQIYTNLGIFHIKLSQGWIFNQNIR
jgi:hypothetical protein